MAFKKGDPVEWQQTMAECGVLADEIGVLIGQSIGAPAGQTSWIHIVGVALMMLQRSLQVPGVDAFSLQWSHAKLLLIHDMMHAYMEGGAEAVTAWVAEQLAEMEAAANDDSDDAPPAPPAPPGCTIH